MQYQTSLLRGQPDNEAIKLLKYYADYAIMLDPRGYCVATSEGKDSRVLGHLMRRAGVPHFYMHSITGIDPPELIYFQRKNFQKYRDAGYDTHDVMYELSMWALMRKKKNPPLRTARYCCEHLKERRVACQGESLLSLGVRATESVRRRLNRAELEAGDTKRRATVKLSFDNAEDRRKFEVCYSDMEKRINPILEWTTADIWSYSKEAKLEQCSLYQEGFDRLGCIGCPMAGENGRKMEFARWPKFKHLFLRAFEIMIEERKKCGMKVTSANAQDWFDWWMSDRAQEEQIEGQVKFLI